MPKLCETFIETRVQKFVGGLGECVEGELGKHREAQAHSNHIDLGIDSEIDRQLDAYLDLWSGVACASFFLLPPFGYDFVY